MNRLALAGVLCLYPCASRAQTWTPLPNGGLGYTTSYSTSGIFRCDPLNKGIAGGTCTANGSSLRLTSGAAILDLIYHPITTTIMATAATSRAPMGWVETNFSGAGPFTFPTHVHGFNSILFDVTLSGPGTIQFGYMNLEDGTNTLRRNCCNFYVNTMTQRPTPPPPSPYDYDEVVYYNFDYPEISPEDAFVSIDADVTLIPEPSSVLLVGTALVGIAGAARARQRKRASRP